MNNLLKMEKYQLSHNIFYWCGLIGIFLIGFFTADTYVPEAMGPMGGAATSLADIFNGMVYDVILCQEKVQIKNDFFPSCQHT